MKNILVAQIHGLGTLARGVMLETLQKLIDENPDANIYYLTCSNSFNVCYINTEKHPEVCYLCKKGIKKGLRMVNGDFIHLEINDIVIPEDYKLASAHAEKHPVITKMVKFKDYEVGEAAVSSYITKTRDRNLVDIEGSFANDLVFNDVVFYNALERFYKEKSISEVYNWNGRNSYQRAVLNLSRKNNIECFNIEIARPGGFLDTFKNALPHNINTKVNLINQAWNNSSHSKEERESIGSSFFEKRFKGLKTNDKIYIKDQVRDKLPEGVDYNKRTFVIFTSSDDEFAAVGKDFENPFFEDQNQGIAFVANLFSTQFPSANLLIRMHPNLKGVNYEYVEELRKMDQISPNVRVITPESDIDSYALLKVAEKVIVFGSTIGLEANYWGKPVVLLGKCFWYYEDIAYIPENKGQILHLLDKELEPKNRANAIKFGYYFLEGGERTSYYDEDVNEKRDYYKGKKLYDFNMWELMKAKIIQRAQRDFGVRLFVN